jgi:cytochrome c oxidase subunit 3
MATGFHGIHVIVGTIMLTIAYYRVAKNHFSRTRHLGFEVAA